MVNANKVKTALNLTVDDIRPKWPLKTHKQGIGYKIYGTFNISTFNPSGPLVDQDTVKMWIEDYNLDSQEELLTEFVLTPCKILTVVLQLEQQRRIDRPKSPCVDEYPSKIKELLALPHDMYNDIYENLPYNEYTCVKLCSAMEWVKMCNCVPTGNAYKYMGRRYPRCSKNEGNCSSAANLADPHVESSLCGCYSACNPNKFVVEAYHAENYLTGNHFWVESYSHDFSGRAKKLHFRCTGIYWYNYFLRWFIISSTCLISSAFHLSSKLKATTVGI